MHISSNPGKNMYTRLRHLPDFAIQRPTFLYRPRFPVGQIQKKKQRRKKKLKETKYEINIINKHAQCFLSFFHFDFAAAKFTVDYYAKNCLMKFPNQLFVALVPPSLFSHGTLIRWTLLQNTTLLFTLFSRQTTFFIIIILIVVIIQWVLFDALVICV